MGLIDEQDRALGQAAEVGDEGGGGRALEAGGAEPAEHGEVRDEAEGAGGGERDGEDVVAGGIEALGEEREGRAFAAAALGDEAGDRVAGEGEAEAFEGGLEGRGAQRRGRGGGPGERGPGGAGRGGAPSRGSSRGATRGRPTAARGRREWCGAAAPRVHSGCAARSRRGAGRGSRWPGPGGRAGSPAGGCRPAGGGRAAGRPGRRRRPGRNRGGRGGRGAR